MCRNGYNCKDDNFVRKKLVSLVSRAVLWKDKIFMRSRSLSFERAVFTKKQMVLVKMGEKKSALCIHSSRRITFVHEITFEPYCDIPYLSSGEDRLACTFVQSLNKAVQRCKSVCQEIAGWYKSSATDHCGFLMTWFISFRLFAWVVFCVLAHLWRRFKPCSCI